MFSLSSLDNTLWLAEPTRLKQAIARVAKCPACPTARELAALRRERLDEAREMATKAIRSSRGKVGVLPIHGPLDQRMSAALMKAGGTSTEEISVALDAMLRDPAITDIVLHVDSPGGYSYGIEELGDKIYNARGTKKIYAVADSMAARPGHWLFSAAEVTAVTPGGDVGSVGVYAVHVDESKMMEEDGVKVTMVSAGKYKTELSPFGPLGDDARAYLQEQVNYQHDKFLAALKRNRNVSLEAVRKDFGQGRMVNAEEAVSRGMADRVMSFEDLLDKLTGGAKDSGGRSRAAVEVMRLRQEQRKRAG